MRGVVLQLRGRGWYHRYILRGVINDRSRISEINWTIIAVYLKSCNNAVLFGSLWYHCYSTSLPRMDRVQVEVLTYSMALERGEVAKTRDASLHLLLRHNIVGFQQQSQRGLNYFQVGDWFGIDKGKRGTRARRCIISREHMAIVLKYKFHF